MDKQCAYCKKRFERHGNASYCGLKCYDKSKRLRQKEDRDAIKDLLPILIANHKLLTRLLKVSPIATRTQLEQSGFDMSIVRRLQRGDEFVYGCGIYSLITTDTINFKIETL